MSEMLMTEAATTTEGQTASQAPAETTTTVAAEAGEQQQSSDGQTAQAPEGDAGSEKTGGEEGKPDGEQPKGAPEQYEFTAPEGREFDAEVIEAFSEAARELDLTQDDAQKVLDKVAPVMERRAQHQLEAIRTEWAQASQTDKEFGGDKLGENLSVAKKALDQFGTPELKQLLEKSGLGNNPEVIRFMFRAGKAISEDRYVGADNGAGSAKGQPKGFNDMAAALYS